MRRILFASAVIVAPLLITAGCAIPAPPPPSPPAPLGREFVTDYNRISSIVFDEDTTGTIPEAKRWVVLPHAVAIFEGADLRLMIDRRAGLEGAVVSVDQDPERIWVGTTLGLFSIDKDGDYVKSFSDGGSPLDKHVVSLDAHSELSTVWAVTRAGVARIEKRFSTWESFPFERPTLPRSDLVAVSREFVWVGSADGIQRFSKKWRRWDAFYPAAQGAPKPLRLAVDVSGNVWAVTEDALYRYDGGFDTWKRADF